MNDIKSRKNELRKNFKALRGEIGAEERAERDALICRRITSLASFRFADAVLLYSPIDGEVDVAPIAKEALRLGKSVYFPKCGERPFMDFRRVDSPDMLVPGRFGVPEPSGDCPVFTGDGTGTVCIVPALSFDRRGYRLGYGGGYYDRFLSRYRGSGIGVVYDGFLSDELPRGRFDVRVDLVVTEKRALTVRTV